MKQRIQKVIAWACVLAASCLILSPTTIAQTEKRGNLMISIKTNHGTIKAKLLEEEAPKTVANFKSYIEAGFYDGTIFHRVIPGFMIQGGGFTEQMEQKQTQAPVNNEANNGVKNTIGTLAMARTQDPHSATSQFFINVSDNDFLNFSSESSQGWGYAVFGEVVEGLDVVQKIEQVDTGILGHYRDVPKEPVLIESITLVE
jgi:peptidyl-prolyl cis-trans isomerase B (cyclophilin B)